MAPFGDFRSFALILITSVHVTSLFASGGEHILTTQQRMTLDKFREAVLGRLPHGYMRQDVYLMRWLRARNWNTDAAERMLMQSLKWRKDNEMDNILDEDWSYMKSEFPYSLRGKDKEGRPLFYMDFGTMDFRKAFISGNGERFARYMRSGMEEASKLVRDLGENYPNVSQGITMVNMGGFSIIQHVCLRCAPVLFQILLDIDANYPGLAEKYIFVNIPAIIEPMMRTGKSLLSPETSRGLYIFGTDKREWRPFLQKHFEDSQLAVELGGTMETDEWK